MRPKGTRKKVRESSRKLEKETKEEPLFENTEGFWTYKQLAERSGLSEVTLYRYVAEEKLTALRFGRSVRFEPELAIRQLRKIGATDYVSRPR